MARWRTGGSRRRKPPTRRQSWKPRSSSTPPATAISRPAPRRPVLVNIAYHNAAELALRGGDGGRAIAFCRQAFERLLALVETDGTPAGLRRDSLAALRRAFLALGDMAERSGEGRDAAEACLARMQALVARPA